MLFSVLVVVRGVACCSRCGLLFLVWAVDLGALGPATCREICFPSGEVIFLSSSRVGFCKDFYLAVKSRRRLAVGQADYHIIVTWKLVNHEHVSI